MYPYIPPARIFQINISNGGVPKLPVPSAEITDAGVAGDRQRDLEHHGGLQRAVCLYSLELILALQAEGHPIYPGAAGENLTLAGLDWELVLPGVQLRLGRDVLVEVTHFTTPCSNLIPYFIDGGFSRISHKLYPGWARVYAHLIEPGTAGVGDRVEIWKPS